MNEYQVLARKYRPQTFADVIGQHAVVTTLKNAIKHDRLAHAYLFSGSRGTGKTSVARIFAKALNCPHRTNEGEPCNACQSCREITSGNSLDVLEIDGASHRGIDDIRQINDNVGYASSSGAYKIYLIDEVHMLTKEAFNALLKTLEEPPPKVKFFFATTEPHKVLPTIISRCQRFNLNRIPLDHLMQSLRAICQDLDISAEESALHLIASSADGGLRDAQSTLDQLISFNEGTLTEEAVADALAIVSHDVLFTFDQAIKEGRYTAAFELTNKVFAQGKDLGHFVESLIEHYRHLLLVKLMGEDDETLDLTTEQRTRYQAGAAMYRQEQLLSMLDLLMEAQQQLRHLPNQRIGLENLLLKLMRSYRKMPVEHLVRRLIELEEGIAHLPELRSTPTPSASQQELALSVEKTENEMKAPPATQTAVSVPAQPAQPPVQSQATAVKNEGQKDSPPPAAPRVLSDAERQTQRQKQAKLDTLLQFAKVELGGSIEKKGPLKFDD